MSPNPYWYVIDMIMHAHHQSCCIQLSICCSGIEEYNGDLGSVVYRFSNLSLDEPGQNCKQTKHEITKISISQTKKNDLSLVKKVLLATEGLGHVRALNLI